MGLPRSLTEVCETVNSGRMLCHSLSVDFDLEVFIHPYETDITVPAEHRHEGHVPGALNVGLSGQFASWAGALIPLGSAFGFLRLSPLDGAEVSGYRRAQPRSA